MFFFSFFELTTCLEPNQSSAQITKLTGFNERKAVTAVGKTETFAVRGYIHNDWDDDL